MTSATFFFLSTFNRVSEEFNNPGVSVRPTEIHYEEPSKRFDYLDKRIFSSSKDTEYTHRYYL